jgi:UDP-N-acetylglucosamine 2-epimerase (non-hydrolysing)
MLTLLHVVGARPNFMKLAPVFLAGQVQTGIRQVIVHTGQHYDRNMSDRFFEDLGIPFPDENLGVGSGSHAEQTANIMLRFEPVLDRHSPDWVVVYGDVNSTIACALVAAKKGIRVAHVEAGLRSATAPCRRRSIGC